MPITERTLKKWRKEALKEGEAFKILPEGEAKRALLQLSEWNERILRMTQELLDQHLIRRVK